MFRFDAINKKYVKYADASSVISISPQKQLPPEHVEESGRPGQVVTTIAINTNQVRVGGSHMGRHGEGDKLSTTSYWVFLLGYAGSEGEELMVHCLAVLWLWPGNMD